MHNCVFIYINAFSLLMSIICPVEIEENVISLLITKSEIRGVEKSNRIM